MSRGLSVNQRTIMQSIEKNGSINIIQAARVFHGVSKILEGRNPEDVFHYSGIEEIAQVDKVYRTMRSLERRGLVARLLHRRPAIWYYVKSKDGEPVGIIWKEEIYDINLVMDKHGEARFRTAKLVLTYTGTGVNYKYD